MQRQRSVENQNGNCTGQKEMWVSTRVLIVKMEEKCVGPDNRRIKNCQGILICWLFVDNNSKLLETRGENWKVQWLGCITSRIL